MKSSVNTCRTNSCSLRDKPLDQNSAFAAHFRADTISDKQKTRLDSCSLRYKLVDRNGAFAAHFRAGTVSAIQGSLHSQFFQAGRCVNNPLRSAYRVNSMQLFTVYKPFWAMRGLWDSLQSVHNGQPNRSVINLAHSNLRQYRASRSTFKCFITSFLE